MENEKAPRVWDQRSVGGLESDMTTGVPKCLGSR